MDRERVLVGKSEGRKPCGGSRREDNIKIDLKEDVK
jgi:hypothetical protein